MVIFLAITPIVALMAWTFLKVGTATRVQALAEERRVRALHSAEAALRYYLLSGQPVSLQLNNCQASASLDGAVRASAAPKDDSRISVSIELQLERGFVTRRVCHER